MLIISIQGVHVATVTIGGEVRDEHPTMNKTNIATTFWQLFEEGAGGRFEVDVA